MAQNGLSLGKFNMQILKKVEELTLYLIDKDKQLNEQNKKIKRIEAEVKILKDKNKHLNNL